MAYLGARMTRRSVVSAGALLALSVVAACGGAATSTPPPAAAKPTEAAKATAAGAAQPTAAVGQPTAPTKPAEPTKPAAAPAGPTPSPTPAESTLAAKSGKETVEIWHTYGGGVGRDVLLAMVKDFNEKTGLGVNESFNSHCCDARIQQKFTAAAAAGQVPDVYNTTSPNVWGGRGTLFALDDYMKRDGFVLNEKDWFPNPVFYARFEGKTYGLPYDTDSRGLFWNKAHFKEAGLDPEKPPRTWTELKDYSQKLTKKEGDRFVRLGFSPLYGESWQWGYVGQAGGYPFIDWDSKPPKPRFDTPESVKAHEFMLELTELAGGVTQLRAFQQGFQTGASQPFMTGQVSMMYHGSWYPATLRQYKPDMEFGRDYGITDQCIADQGGKLYCQTGGWSMTVPKDAKRKDQGWEFTRWFAEDPQLLRWNRETDHVPTKLSIGTDPAFSKMPIKFFMDAMRYAGGWPSGPWTSAPKYTMTNAQDDVLFKKRSAKDALTEASTEYQKIINEYYETKR